MDRNRHMATHTIDPDMTEALRRVVAGQIGPRKPGVVYNDGVTNLRVVDVITSPSEARRILRRRAAQFAVIVRDLHPRPGQPVEYATCATWTGTDRVLKAVA